MSKDKTINKSTAAEYYLGEKTSDYSTRCVVRRLRWYEKLWLKLRRKPTPQFKMVSAETVRRIADIEDSHEQR